MYIYMQTVMNMSNTASFPSSMHSSEKRVYLAFVII